MGCMNFEGAGYGTIYIYIYINKYPVDLSSRAMGFGYSYIRRSNIYILRIDNCKLWALKRQCIVKLSVLHVFRHYIWVPRPSNHAAIQRHSCSVPSKNPDRGPVQNALLVGK